MKVLSSLSIILLIVSQGKISFAQKDTISLNTIIEKTQKEAQEYPSEKVYLHFDKPYYAVGDTIWFKAYLALGQNQPSDLSKVLYVDVLSDNDTLVRSLKLPVVNTSAYGSLTLDPLVYKAGNYHVRAYTYWMLNTHDSYFFRQNIRIGNAINRQVITNITLKGEETTKDAKIRAQVYFKDPSGNPYSNKKVNWRVISKFETIEKGRGTTDAKGLLDLVLTANQKAALDTGKLETILELDNARLITSTFPLKNSFAEADIQFFPEGGELLENVKTKIAFKAIKAGGLGMSVKGEISDQDGTIITTLESQHFGMGAFTLVPETGKTYKASLTFANGVKKTINLPKTETTGLSLFLNNSDPTNLNLSILSSTSYFSANQNKNYYIIARSKGIICYAAQAKLVSAIFSVQISKDKFPTGIVQITVFSSFGEPLSERLSFIKHPDLLTLSLTSDKKAYKLREQVKMAIAAKNRNEPVQGNFSVSVINESKVPVDENEETTILSSFLLSSELQGYIEKPNYYFTPTTDKKLADLDLLLMTQGYRKFSYSEILDGKEPIISFYPEQGIEYTGTLRSSNGMPISKGSLRLVVPESRFYTETSTNIEGKFRFKNIILPDSAEVSITARSNTGAKNMMIMLDGTAFPAINKNINAPDEILNIDSALKPYLTNSERQYRFATQMLQEVVIKSTVINKPSHTDYSALAGLSMMPDHLIEGDRFKGCNLFLTCLQTSALGLTYNDENFYVTRVYNSGLRVPVQIFYNGMAVDASYLNTIVPADVESVEIFLKDELGMVNRTYNTNGALVINSKKIVNTPVTADQLRKLFPPTNVLTFKPLGYIKKREFYLPKYTTEASKSAGIDLRTTVYWNPKIFTDKEGKMTFDFYNGDSRGTYKAILEGTDIEGNLARYIYRYKIE